MRSRPANISVAASRTTVARRIVETSEPDHRQHGTREPPPGPTGQKRSQEALAGFVIQGGSAHLTGPSRVAAGLHSGHSLGVLTRPAADPDRPPL